MSRRRLTSAWKLRFSCGMTLLGVPVEGWREICASPSARARERAETSPALPTFGFGKARLSRSAALGVVERAANRAAEEGAAEGSGRGHGELAVALSELGP